MPFLGEGVGEHGEHSREQYLSLIYDWFVGHHLFDYIALVLEKHFAVDPRKLQTGCRERLRRHFPEVSGWFPKGTTYYFSDEPQPENGYALIDTRQAAVWR